MVMSGAFWGRDRLCCFLHFLEAFWAEWQCQFSWWPFGRLGLENGFGARLVLHKQIVPRIEETLQLLAFSEHDMSG